ncbi:hypothetical protein BH11ARM1_BH11ARM1_03300 [soil metagenome]
MIHSLAALLFFAQAPALSLPAGASSEFQSQILKVQVALDSGQFDKAKELLAPLPSHKVQFVWNDAGLTEKQKSDFVRAREMAFMAWKRFLPGVTFEIAPTGGLSFSFQPSLPPRPNADLPAGMTLNVAAGQVQAVIAGTRGKPTVPTGVFDVQSDVMRSVGAYLGVSDLPFGGNVMAINDQPLSRMGAVPKYQADIALANIAVVQGLRDAAEKKQASGLVPGTLKSPEAAIEMGRIMQGEKKKFSFEIANTGKGELKLWIRPECGCMTLEAPAVLTPGQTQKIDVDFDSSDFRGTLERLIYIISNDPTNPLTVVKMESIIVPPFRFLNPAEQVVVVGDKPTVATVYLVANGTAPFEIKDAEMAGFNADVTWEPWQGTIADPEMKEPAKARKGYKLSVTVPTKLIQGRSPGTLMVSTDDPKFPQLQYQMYAQKGIVALPDELFLGNLSGPRSSKFLVSRPGKPFKVLSASSDSSDLKLAVRPGKDSQEWVIEVEYSGKATIGDFTPTITVKTDDPKQPTIKVPVIGTVQ